MNSAEFFAVAPHWYERCPVHGDLVKFSGEGRLLGRCQRCATEAAEAIRTIERKAA